MRRFLPIVISLAVCSFAAQPQADAQENGAASGVTYLVTIVEAKLSEQETSVDTKGETLWSKLRDSSKTDWSESLQFTVLEGHDAKLKFGRTVSVVTSVNVHATTKTMGLKEAAVGTNVAIIVKATGTKLEVELDYQAMRLAGENNGELPPPDMEKNEFSSLLLLDLGAPKMLVSTPNSVLMLRIDFESRK